MFTEEVAAVRVEDPSLLREYATAVHARADGSINTVNGVHGLPTMQSIATLGPEE
jgi:hypothetical protein